MLDGCASRFAAAWVGLFLGVMLDIAMAMFWGSDVPLAAYAAVPVACCVLSGLFGQVVIDFIWELIDWHN